MKNRNIDQLIEEFSKLRKFQRAVYDRMLRIVNKFDHLLVNDQMLNEKMRTVLVALRESSKCGPSQLGNELEMILIMIKDCAIYTKDMAEEEQRIIEESHDVAAGNEEKEAEHYFVLSSQLSMVSKLNF